MGGLRGRVRGSLAVAVLSLAIAVSVASAAVDFAPRQVLRTGPATVDVQLGDINGDGVADIVAAPAQFGIQPFLAGGGGAFASAAPSAVGIVVNAFQLVDVNRDGRLDVVAVNPGANTVSVLLGNGLGAFGPATRIAVGTGPVFIATGDLNGDSTPDFAVANLQSSNLSVLLGVGDGTFSTATVDLGRGPAGLAIADLNGDQKLDLAVTTIVPKGEVSVLLGTGNGAFTAPLRSRTGGDLPLGISVGDVNRDAIPDLAVANFGSNEVSLMIGQGNGLFQATRLRTSTFPVGTAIVDVNADSVGDVVTSNLGSDDLTVLEGSATGFADGKQFFVGLGPGFIRSGDVNGDGRNDLVVANLGGSVVILPSRVLPPGTRGTAKGVVGCAKARRVVVGETISCAAPGMSRFQVKELLGRSTARVNRPGGREALFYGRRRVIFERDGNFALEVWTERPGDGTGNGVAVGGSASFIKKRYPEAKCTTKKDIRNCLVRVDSIDTEFLSRNGRIYAIVLSFES